MKIIFDKNAKSSPEVENSVKEFLSKVSTLESKHDMPVVVFEDGVNGSYYIKCNLSAETAAGLCDLNAKLDVKSPESYKANRELLLDHHTYLKMASDAGQGREFNDIIVEYNTDYNSETPLKVWGGQHRIKAILEAGKNSNRHHGFRVYFNLTKDMRTEVALISNTNIAISNDVFDRMIEEAKYGYSLRNWCQKVGMLHKNKDFPDAGSRSEDITVKLARSFIINFYLGKEKGGQIPANELDKNLYEPYLAQTGATVDLKYEKVMTENNILKDESLIKAGRSFAALHGAQYKAVTNKESKLKKRKAYRNKALVESVLSGWSYVAGLLQTCPERLENHYKVPKTTRKVPDPLNAEEMSQFKHDSDPPTYRGLGTRSSSKDRQRIAQLFLAKSKEPNAVIDKELMTEAISQVVAIINWSRGYTPKC